MHLKALVGAGHRIAALALPFVVAGVIADLLWPSAFRMGLNRSGRIAGIVLLVMGVPLWLISAVQIITLVPKGKLIRSGPFALVRHPLYTWVALLVIPGCGFLFDSWIGLGAWSHPVRLGARVRATRGQGPRCSVSRGLSCVPRPGHAAVALRSLRVRFALERTSS